MLLEKNTSVIANIERFLISDFPLQFLFDGYSTVIKNYDLRICNTPHVYLLRYGGSIQNLHLAAEKTYQDFLSR